MSGSSVEALGAYRTAVQLARESGHVDLHLLALNNHAYTLYELGHDQDAVALCEQMLEVLHQHHLDLPLHVLDTVANAYLAVGRAHDAEDLFARVDLTDAAPEDAAESWLTLAGCGATRTTWPARRTPSTAACAPAPTTSSATSRCGRWPSRPSSRGPRPVPRGVRAVQAVPRTAADAVRGRAEARARMMQAIFETERARRESARFREMSYRDALTQLYNRRYVDDHLTSLLDGVGEPGRLATLALAFVDLDHFKLVNDTCSHEVGDEVLRRVARLLDEHARQVPEGFAARMGGEEFLVVLPGMDAGSAPALLERLRLDLAAIEWDGLTLGVPVTASLGCAVAPDDGTSGWCSWPAPTSGSTPPSARAATGRQRTDPTEPALDAAADVVG